MTLQIITGVVSELKVSSEYVDIFSDSEKTGLGIAAIGAAAIGQAFNATALAATTAAAELELQFFSCNADGVPIAGKFDSVDFHNGDVIDFVVSSGDSVAICHAARSESKRVLWMQPYHVRGSDAQKLHDIKSAFTRSFLITLALAIITQITNPPPNWQSRVAADIIIFFICLLVLWWVSSRFAIFAFKTNIILQVLGYESPERVDLARASKMARRLAKDSGVLSPWTYRY
jgi:hypothetical protein